MSVSSPFSQRKRRLWGLAKKKLALAGWCRRGVARNRISWWPPCPTCLPAASDFFFRMMKQLRYGAARTQHPTYYNNVRCLQRYVSYLVSSFSSFKCRPVLFSLILLPLRLYRLLHIGTVMVAAAAAAASSLFIYSFFVSRGNLKDAAHSTFSFVYFFEKRRDEKGARDPKWPTLSFFLSPSRFRDNSLLPTRVFVVLIWLGAGERENLADEIFYLLIFLFINQRLIR